VLIVAVLVLARISSFHCSSLSSATDATAASSHCSNRTICRVAAATSVVLRFFSNYRCNQLLRTSKVRKVCDLWERSHIV
jgi:hypothetical protein